MLLRSSISGTKKFFQKTIKNFKSFFSPGYERLPKTPPHNHFSYSVAGVKDVDMNSNTGYQELDKYYTDFNVQWDSEQEKARRRSKKKDALPSPTKQENEVYSGSYMRLSNASPAKKNQVEQREEYGNQNKERRLTHQTGRQKDSSFSSLGMREDRNYVVEQKLRELEMLDISNVDYVLDIEEVLHYYSRLTCPAYLEIVDRFFTEMYSEFFAPAWPSTPCRMKPRYQ